MNIKYLQCVAVCQLFFSLPAAGSKTLSGLLEFDSKTEAVETLTVLNHHQIRIPSEFSPEADAVQSCGLQSKQLWTDQNKSVGVSQLG